MTENQAAKKEKKSKRGNQGVQHTHPGGAGATAVKNELATFNTSHTTEGKEPSWFAGAIFKLEINWVNKWANVEAEMVALKKDQKQGFKSL